MSCDLELKFHHWFIVHSVIIVKLHKVLRIVEDVPFVPANTCTRILQEEKDINFHFTAYRYLSDEEARADEEEMEDMVSIL